MYHSVSISGKNTYDEWGLIPTSRLLVNPPSVKTDYVDLPNVHGQLDYTSYLLGEVPMGQRTGSWEFVCRPGTEWATVYSSILNYLHGQRHRIILDDDSDWQYIGRLTVNEWKSEESLSKITIDYNLDAFKYSTEQSEDMDWLWDDLFAILIKYGRFTVSGRKYRTFVNNGIRATVPTFDCSNPVSVTFDDVTYNLVKGKNYNLNLTLQPGDNEMQFAGNADIVVSYSEVSL